MIEVKLAGRYRLEVKVADGAVGSVWRATDEVLDRTVAVKTLHPSLASDDLVRERFRIEALSAARLTHPNIVAIFDTGDGDGTPFFVMEHLEGGTLRSRLDADIRLAPAQVVRIGVEVSAALEHAHAHGIVHRAIKPSNILFTDAGRAKLSDFGLVAPEALKGAADRLVEPGGETTGNLGGVRYLSPEQVDGAPGDHRSDLYALGLVLYEALTGHPPFSGSSDLAAAIKRQAAVPARPQQLRPDVPRALDEVVVRALQPSPADRFADAAEMRRALTALAAGEDTDEELPMPVAAPDQPGEPASFVKTEGRWLLPALLAVLAIGAVLVVAVKPGIVRRIGNPFSGGGGDTKAETVTVQASGAFDPEGDGEEHDSEVPRAFDGNPGTRWRTTGYTSADFGRLKSGVGIWFDVGKPVSLRQIRVLSQVGGWQGTIRTSDDGASWSRPGNPEEAGTDKVFETSGTHRYWMVWITRLTATPGLGGPSTPYGVGISEIEPTAG